MDTSESALTPVAVVSAALARGASTARDLADASISVNTRLAYRSALAGFDGSGAPETDDGIASYLGQLFDAGRAASSASMVVAAIRFRARLAGRTSPTGPAVDRALAGFRRKAQGRGRGQAPAMLADDLAAIAATARQPRQSRNGRGVESAAVADRRGRVDLAIAGLSLHGGLRRSEIGQVRAADVAPAASVPGAVLVTVRTSKTNQDGSSADVRMVKNGPAGALRELVERADGPGERLISLSGPMVQRRLQAAAVAAGVEHRLTGHSGRVGLASELTARGASTADVMLAGGWKTCQATSGIDPPATPKTDPSKKRRMLLKWWVFR